MELLSHCGADVQRIGKAPIPYVTYRTDLNHVKELSAAGSRGTRAHRGHTDDAAAEVIPMVLLTAQERLVGSYNLNVSSVIKVLLVEDRAEDADLIVRELRRSGLSIAAQRVDSAAAYELALAGFAPDLILSDYALPGFDGSEALRIAQRKRPDTPFIFVSGTIGEERAIEALKQGAVDYVLKDNRARLVPAVERALQGD